MPVDASKTIVIACDHGGIDLKADLTTDLEDKGYEVLNLGTNGPESVDYPDFAYALAHAIKDGKATRGVLICGSSIGICMAANRFPEIRAAQIHDALGARLCREHNDANVIAFGARVIGVETARDCLNTFLNTEFEGGRHVGRVDKLSNPQ
ncbi:MAG: ribose 5-phosphate isomerase B [Rhodospirillaceae bacterium]|nr:ribose 5-phosphate isomerase B [Rhodospirillaceae bacterium]MBT7953720.1 ribose 5-phosphate isomerase B [Rhodospirillaceae bacterium]